MWLSFYRVQGLLNQYNACQQRVQDLEKQIQITEQRLARAGEVLAGVSLEGSRWAIDAKIIQEDKSKLLSDVLLASGDSLTARCACNDGCVPTPVVCASLPRRWPAMRG